MTVFLDAAMSELDLLCIEIESLQSIIQEPECSAVQRCAITIRLDMLLSGKYRLQGRISNELEKLDIRIVLKTENITL